mmetsp:Transcript_9546/g.35746  ORF Transcript_9546/g.35746 Transcript_9546/m.35746 type:complete len:243 (+) Transcript_9546:635-1363(+)
MPTTPQCRFACLRRGAASTSGFPCREQRRPVRLRRWHTITLLSRSRRVRTNRTRATCRRTRSRSMSRSGSGGRVTRTGRRGWRLAMISPAPCAARTLPSQRANSSHIFAPAIRSFASRPSWTKGTGCTAWCRTCGTRARRLFGPRGSETRSSVRSTFTSASGTQDSRCTACRCAMPTLARVFPQARRPRGRLLRSQARIGAPSRRYASTTTRERTCRCSRPRLTLIATKSSTTTGCSKRAKG